MFKRTYALCATIAVLMAGPAMAAPEIGQPAPDFTGIDVLSGEEFTLSDHKGEVVVLEWTNHNCPFVVKQYDTKNMQKTQEAARADGATWVTIVSSAPNRQGHVSPEEAAEIVKVEGASPSAKILDESGEIGHAYDAKTTPHMFVIDKDGTLVYAGAIDSDPSPRHESVEGATNYVTAALDALKNGQPVEPASTNPYGCAVKYDH